MWGLWVGCGAMAKIGLVPIGAILGAASVGVGPQGISADAEGVWVGLRWGVGRNRVWCYALSIVFAILANIDGC